MGIFNRKEIPEYPEKAMIKDHLGFWPVDMEEAFSLYRKRKYLYHGPIHMNGAIVHVFAMPEGNCE